MRVSSIFSTSGPLPPKTSNDPYWPQKRYHLVSLSSVENIILKFLKTSFSHVEKIVQEVLEEWRRDFHFLSRSCPCGRGGEIILSPPQSGYQSVSLWLFPYGANSPRQMSLVSVGITGREVVFPLRESESLTIIHSVVSQGIRTVSSRFGGERTFLNGRRGWTCAYLSLSI